MTTTQPVSNSFAKRLAHTDKAIRDKAVKALGKWLSSREELDQLELLKLWKGLFYCFWMSDKPLVQQQLSNTLATMVLNLPSTVAIPFVKAFWEIIVREWNGIDRYRLDKFYLLLRRYVHFTLVFLMKNEWDSELVDQYVDMMKNGVFCPGNAQIPVSVRLHVSDLFLEELEKVVPEEQREQIPMEKLLFPFFHFVSRNPNKLVFTRMQENIFRPLLERMTQLDSEEEEQKSVYNYQSIAQSLVEIMADPETTGIKRRRIKKFLSGFSGSVDLENATEMEGVDSMDIEEEEEEEEEIQVVQPTKKELKKRKRQKNEQAPVEEAAPMEEAEIVDEVVSEPVSVKENKKKKKQKVVEIPVETPTEVVAEPVKETKKKKKQQVEVNSMEVESVEETTVTEEVSQPIKAKASKKQKKQKVVEETVQQVVDEISEEIAVTEEPVKKVSKKSKKQKIVETEVVEETAVVEAPIKKSKKKVKAEEVSTPKPVEPSTPISNASKKSVQWGLENNSVKRFKKQLPVSPKPSPVSSDRKPIKSALKKSKRSFISITKSST
ncbi:hypothetical protein K7432_001179 [Basidiobolus ranarum]|uniref:Nop52-domain-containing protein n=1 Tax=Basidiobolus ranarum TaxID=34480 RepID=A0ABR2WA16_9FUNG